MEIFIKSVRQCSWADSELFQQENAGLKLLPSHVTCYMPSRSHPGTSFIRVPVATPLVPSETSPSLWAPSPAFSSAELQAVQLFSSVHREVMEYSALQSTESGRPS